MQVKKKDLWTVVTLRNNGAYVARLKATYINNGKMEEQNTGSFPGYLLLFKLGNFQIDQSYFYLFA